MAGARAEAEGVRGWVAEEAFRDAHELSVTQTNANLPGTYYIGF